MKRISRGSEGRTGRRLGGLTLVETLCAAVLLGFALVQVVGMFSYGAQLTADASQRSAAAQLLGARMSALQAMDVAQLTSPWSETAVVGSVAYTVYVTPTQPVAGDARLASVTATVRWTGRSGRASSLVRQTLLVQCAP